MARRADLPDDDERRGAALREQSEDLLPAVGSNSARLPEFVPALEIRRDLAAAEAHELVVRGLREEVVVLLAGAVADGQQVGAPANRVVASFLRGRCPLAYIVGHVENARRRHALGEAAGQSGSFFS